MKKLLLLGAIALSGMVTNAQNYCEPSFPSGCGGGDVINDFKIPTVGFEDLATGCADNGYDDRTAIMVNLQAGVPNDYEVTHSWSNQRVKIWIDFNNDGVFDNVAPELVAHGQSGGEPITTGTFSIPATVPEGQYRMRIATKFGADPFPCNVDGYGEAHDYTVSIAAPPSCIIPTAFSSSFIGATKAGVTWEASTSAVNVGYQVYYSTENIAPDDTTVLNDTNSVSVGSTDTSATLSGLMSETTYYAWVRANCDATDNSDWTPSISFTTNCAAKVPNYTENFDNMSTNQNEVSLPCWIFANGGDANTGYTSLGESSWRGVKFLKDDSNSIAAAIDLYNDEHKGWMISPVFDLSGGTEFELTFDYGVTEYFNSNPSSMGSDDYVQLLVSVDEGSTWTVIETWNASNTPSNESTTYTLDLAPYISSQTTIAFYGTDGAIDDDLDFLFHVENFAVTETTGVGTINQELTSLEVYPNPAIDVINISNDVMINNVEIYDINGRRLLNQSVGQTSTTIDVSSFATGTYFVKVTAEGKTSTKQIVVK